MQSIRFPTMLRKQWSPGEVQAWLDDHQVISLRDVPEGCTPTDARVLREANVKMAAEVERLRDLAATCYAALGAECDLPEPWLDALSDAAEGRPFSTEKLLPFSPAGTEHAPADPACSQEVDQSLGLFTLPTIRVGLALGRHLTAIAAEKGVILQAHVRDLLTDASAMEARKDAAYLERNQVVAALAKAFPSGVARTAIEGWSEDWHGCVFIDLPTGQASWHFHDSQAYLFEGLPPYTKPWDGHTTEEKYDRLARLQPRRRPPTHAWLKEMADLEDAAACPGCGAIAGCCPSYPNCPGGPKA